MKKQITFVILLLITFSFFNLKSHASEDFTKAMLKARKHLKEAMNKSDESALLKVRGEFERILQLKEDAGLVHYYIALADYGLATVGMRTEDKDKTKKYTQSGIDVINKSIELNPDFADSYVLLETLNFNRWGYEPEKMQDIISASQAADAQATKLEKDNPRLVLINGISSYFTPEAYGGGVKVAIPHFEKAIELFKKRKEKNELYPDWGYDMALGYMALSLIKRNDDGDMIKAKTYIDEATKINPDSGFIKSYVMEEYKKNSGSK